VAVRSGAPGTNTPPDWLANAGEPIPEEPFMSLLAARARTGIVSALAAALLIPGLALASDPASPAALVDDGPGFRFTLALAVSPATVSVSAIYNRFAGAVVDAGAATVSSVPVRRQLAVQWDPQGNSFIDVHPIIAGQPPLPNGVYSQWLEVRHTPEAGARGRVPFTFRRAIYFRVVDGTVQRLSHGAYSALADPISQRRNKLGEQEPVHLGATAPRQTSVAMPPMPMIESGQGYSSPNNSELGQ
jgi:hypothetical protein